jgi:hypothetical protein
MHQPVENAAYGLATHDLWEANVAWVRECVADMQRFSDGRMYPQLPRLPRRGTGDDAGRLRRELRAAGRP